MRKILYVEDDPINALVIQRLLKSEFNVIHSPDGESCLSMLDKEKFELILMDINLGKGKMDGVETMHQIKSNPKTKNLRVIAVTIVFYARDLTPMSLSQLNERRSSGPFINILRNTLSSCTFSVFSLFEE